MKKDYWVLFRVINIIIYAIILSIPIVIVFLISQYPEYFFTLLVYLFFFFAILCGDESCIKRRLLKLFNKNKIEQRKKVNKDEKLELYKTLTELFFLVWWIIPYGRFITMGIAIILPILGIVRYFCHPDKIKFSPNKKEESNALSEMIFLSGGLMTLRGMEDHLYPIHFWILWIIVSLILIIPFFVYVNEYKNNIVTALKYCGCIILFSFGLICTVNYQYDFSKPIEYHTKVIDKYIESGRHGRRSLVIAQEDSFSQTDFKVGWKEYREVEIGEYVIVQKRDGLLKFEWYDLITR